MTNPGSWVRSYVMTTAVPGTPASNDCLVDLAGYAAMNVMALLAWQRLMRQQVLLVFFQHTDFVRVDVTPNS